jgi:hypothetical protein
VIDGGCAGGLREDHDFPPSLIFLHAPMGFDDLVQAKDPSHLNVQTASSDLFHQIFQRHMHEIFRLARVARKTDSGRYDPHRIEVIEGPFVPHDTGHADDAALFCASQGINECRCTYELEDLVRST